MFTSRQVERQLSAGEYTRALRELCAHRPEAAAAALVPAGQGMRHAALAMTVVRLEELGLRKDALLGRCLNAVIAAQSPVGHWFDAITTAWCVRAIATMHPHHPAVERGLGWLAAARTAGGEWDEPALHRMPGNPAITKAVQLLLRNIPAAREALAEQSIVSKAA